MKKGEEDYFPQKLRVRIKDNNNSPHGKFHRFLFPFSSKFSDLNFDSYVLFSLPVLCHVSHTVSLGYLWSYWGILTEGQYSPVQLEQARLVSSLLCVTRAMLVWNLPAFENKKYTAYDRFHGNGPYGEIPTKKGPMRTRGFPSRLPCYIIIRHIYRAQSLKKTFQLGILNQARPTTKLQTYINPQTLQQANNSMAIAHPGVAVLLVLNPVDVVVTVLQVVFRDPVVLIFTAHGSYLYHASFE